MTCAAKMVRSDLFDKPLEDMCLPGTMSSTGQGVIHWHFSLVLNFVSCPNAPNVKILGVLYDGAPAMLTPPSSCILL